MKIIDVSHWQGNIDWNKVEKDGVDVAIMKVSQGISLVDDHFAKNKAEARKEGLLCGFYHFANGGDAKKEADFFIKTLGELQEGEFVVLDFEIDIANPADWCKTWLDRVSEKLGFKPLLYSNEARIKAIDFKAVAAANYGLWIAKYGDNDDKAEDNEIPNTDEWAFYAMWQFSSTGKVDGIATKVDLNTSTMDLKTLKKYGKPKEVAAPVDPNIAIIADLKKQVEELTKTNTFLKTTGENQDVVISDLKKQVLAKEGELVVLRGTNNDLEKKLKEQKEYTAQVFDEKERLRAENETLKATKSEGDEVKAAGKSFLAKFLAWWNK